MKYSDELKQSSAGNYQWMATNSTYFKRDMWGIDTADLLKNTKDGGIWGITEDEAPVKCRDGEYFFYKVFASLFSSQIGKMNFRASDLYKGKETKTSFDNLISGDFDTQAVLDSLLAANFTIDVLLTVTEKDGNYKQSVLPFPDYVDRGGSQYLRKSIEKKIEKGDQITTNFYSLDYQEFNPTPVVEETPEVTPDVIPF